MPRLAFKVILSENFGLEVTKDWFRPRNTKGDIGGPIAPDSINPKIKWAFGPEDPNYYDPSFWAKPLPGQIVLQAA